MRRLASAAILGALVLWAAPAAHAHPLGNFTVNRYAEIVVTPDRIAVHYVVDLAEIPALQEEQRIDLDGDGLEAHELRRWASRAADRIAEEVVLKVDRRRVPLQVRGATAAAFPGQGGLSTLRIDATLRASLRDGSGLLSFEDRTDPGRIGWREIIARGDDEIELVGSTVPEVSVSDRLSSYPEDLLSSPLAVTSMEARFRPGGGATSAAIDPSTQPLRSRSSDGAFAALIANQGMLLMLFGLLAAVTIGAGHALLPGHGKTLMAAAMVGSGARTRQAVIAGVSVASMHTVSVISLGFLVLGMEHAFRPEAVYPWLRLASGVVALGFGIFLVRGRWRSWRAERVLRVESRSHREHGHPGHVHDLPAGDLLSRRGIAALAFAGGILPSPSALIVMLAAIQRGRAAYGLGLVLAFSVGLAASLVAIGLGVMRARRVADRRAWRTVRRVVPLLSACAIVVIGLSVAGSGFASLSV